MLSPTAPRSPALVLHDLTVGYERHPAVHHVSLEVPAGSLWAVVGPNGAGKSTLLKALAGALPPMGGRIERAQGLAGARERVAYLPQQAEIDRSFPVSVLDTVAMGLWHELGPLRRLGAGQRQRCRAALAAVGLSGFEARTLDTLSGGQFQRVLFARLMLRDAPLLLLDEPFAAVDEPTVGVLLAQVHAWQREGRTVIAVLHDLDQVRAHFPHTLLLARQAIAAGPTAEVLTPALLSRAAQLVEAFDEHAPACAAPEPASAAAGHGHAGHAHHADHAH
jgi:zinc/manganese transport system ATP-binding protein